MPAAAGAYRWCGRFSSIGITLGMDATNFCFFDKHADGLCTGGIGFSLGHEIDCPGGQPGSGDEMTIFPSRLIISATQSGTAFHARSDWRKNSIRVGVSTVTFGFVDRTPALGYARFQIPLPGQYKFRPSTDSDSTFYNIRIGGVAPVTDQNHRLTENRRSDKIPGWKRPGYKADIQGGNCP